VKLSDTTQLLGQHKFLLAIVFSGFMLTSCASQAPSDKTSAGSEEPQPKTAQNIEAATSADKSESSDKTENASQGETAKTPAPLKPLTLGESCKQQPFVQYESDARQHIQHGWEATQAQRFGVGFRDKEEYERWKQSHEQLFTKVSEVCEQVSACVKQNPTDKDQKCASQAQRFEQWQNVAQHFVEKVKVVEASQPPMLCSLTPSAEDPSECYSKVAERIGQACQNQQCQEASGCFLGISFLDDAINQAKLACGFVGQKLADCRGYVEATQRRKTNVQQCIDMYKQLPVEILPVI